MVGMKQCKEYYVGLGVTLLIVVCGGERERKVMKSN